MFIYQTPVISINYYPGVIQLVNFISINRYFHVFILLFFPVNLTNVPIYYLSPLSIQNYIKNKLKYILFFFKVP